MVVSNAKLMFGFLGSISFKIKEILFSFYNILVTLHLGFVFDFGFLTMLWIG